MSREDPRLDRANGEIDKFIDKRAQQRKEARDAEQVWKKSVRDYHAKQRETNRQAWIEHYLAMSESHQKLADEYEDKAIKLHKEKP